MQINKNSWHYKVYGWTYEHSFCIPERTNLCQYVQRIVLGSVGICLRFAFLSVANIVALIFYVILMPFALFFGYLPTLFSQKHGEIFTPYSGLKIWGAEFYPYHLLPAGGIVLAEMILAHDYGLKYIVISQASIVAAIITLLVGLYYYDDFKKIEAVSLAKKYFSAKKQGICPLVEFTEGKK